ncbi:transposase [Labilibaculum filiforme]|uniref:Transposase n=1 Tax=Labilibaculum filiforme TaxID=1940526 RepID=A0A2N3I3P8_9BACT|nr:IS200/IS605 family transposase [Labilibaculum filiforme]PKQ64934.1 transposase [Labilibaculum filiforme]
MGQSLSQLYVHLTFGTKFREPYITLDIEKELHAYIIGILKNMESPSLQINSVPDHIHVLFRLSKNYALAKIVEEVKKSSSKWMKEKGVKEFTWQIGYGAFSVSSSAVNKVERYIKQQKKHHNVQDYKEELEELMREYDVIEYDATYFWS